MEEPRPQQHLRDGSAHAPVTFDEADAIAIQALVRGHADELQQQRVVEWLLNKGARIRELSYQPGDPVGTAFAEGRRHVGLQFAKFMTINVGKVRQAHGGHPSEQP